MSLTHFNLDGGLRTNDAVPGDGIEVDGQIEWRGMILGPRSWYGYKKLTGWDDFSIADVNDVEVPRGHGAWPGDMYVANRTVTFETTIWAGLENFAATRKLLIQKMTPTNEEYPLIIRQHGETLMAYARCTSRVVPIDRAYLTGTPVFVLQWLCADPRRYSLDLHQAVVAVPLFFGGLDWSGGLPWNAGLDWGTATHSNVTVENEGSTDTPLTVVFRGPLTPPYHLVSSSGWQLGLSLPLAAGEELVVDCRKDTVRLNNGGSRFGAILAASSIPSDCTLPPGETSLSLRSNDVTDTGTALVEWRHATI